jgi:hypothetical protein
MILQEISATLKLMALASLLGLGHYSDALGSLLLRCLIPASLQGPVSECPEKNQSALFKLGNFLVLNSYLGNLKLR